MYTHQILVTGENTEIMWDYTINRDKLTLALLYTMNKLTSGRIQNLKSWWLIYQARFEEELKTFIFIIRTKYKETKKQSSKKLPGYQFMKVTVLAVTKMYTGFCAAGINEKGKVNG